MQEKAGDHVVLLGGMSEETFPPKGEGVGHSDISDFIDLFIVR
jgi:hypothetical protein